jgi:hypothetical protein
MGEAGPKSVSTLHVVAHFHFQGWICGRRHFRVWAVSGAGEIAHALFYALSATHLLLAIVHLAQIMVDPNKLQIQPELYLRDGRIIRSLGDAIALLRHHEARPGVDARDEVLHGLERAQTDEERQQAVEAFLAWAEELDLLLAPPETARR